MGEVSAEAIEGLERMEAGIRESLEEIKKADCPLKTERALTSVWIRSILTYGQRDQFLVVFKAFLLGTVIGAEEGMADHLEELKQQISQNIRNTDDLTAMIEKVKN